MQTTIFQDFQTVLQKFKEAQRLADEREGPFAPNWFFSVDWPGQSDEEAYQTMITGHEEARRLAIDFDERSQEGLQKVQKHIVQANQILKEVYYSVDVMSNVYCAGLIVYVGIMLVLLNSGM